MKCKMLLVVQFFVHFIDAFHFEVKNENEMRISFCEMKCKNEMQPIHYYPLSRALITVIKALALFTPA